MNCPICSWSSDNLDYLFVTETQHWRICLAPNQSLIRRRVIHLKRHAGDLADLTQAEIIELFRLVKNFEDALRHAFDATMFNWSCYMNNAYKETPPNPHVHWWAVPRYDHIVEFDGRTFEDPNFGNPYDHGRWFAPPHELRQNIANGIKANFVLLGN